jgi:4-amino-4-deoxy-L-arabinose transferase-like glycosyltransferase
MRRHLTSEASELPSPDQRHARARQLVVLLFACLALRVVGLIRPCLSDDEATYCVVGREMLAGRVLYRDVVDHKPPLIYVTYAATQAIGGPTGGMRLLHLLTALVVFATALLIGRVVRDPLASSGGAGGDARGRVPFFAALLYIVFSTTLLDFDSQAANCEIFMLLPLTASVVIYLSALPGRLRFFRLWVAGALVALAMLYKYQAAVQLPLYALHLAWVARRRPARLAAGWGALAAGVAVVLAAAVAILHLGGAWQGAWFWFRFNFAYIKQGFRPSEMVVRAALRISYGVLPAVFLWILGLRAAWASIRRPSRPDDPERVDLFLVGWLLVSALAVTAGGRFFGHYFHQVTAPLAALAAPEVTRLARARPKLVWAALAIPAAAFTLLGLGHDWTMTAAGEPDPDYPAIAAFVDAHSDPGDALVVWGNAPVLYFEARRPLGSRFVFSNYLTGLSPATRTQSDPRADASANVVAESWDMLETDLASRRPRLFVDTSPGNIGAYGKFPTAHFPRLQRILDRDYAPIGEVAGARILAMRTSR